MDKFKETMGKFFGTVKTKWNDMGKKGHIIFLSVAGVILASLIVTVALTTRTEYAVLYSGASAEETAEVLSLVSGELGATEVTVSENGDILVPKKEVEQLRMQLSMQGYPKSTFNYNIWDNGVDMFSTESDKRIKETQQLQENLRATLAMYDGIESAIVLLNIPPDNNYVIGNTKEEASASVFLQLSHNLSNDAVKGVYNLVRTAVPGLKEENISVTDGNATLLVYEEMPEIAEMSGDEEINLYYKRLELQNSITNILKEKLDGIFDGIFPDFRVGVDVQLNYDGEKKQTTEYTPSVDSEGNRGGMVQNETHVSAGGGNAAEGGLVGAPADADISPDYPTLEIGEGDEFYYEWQRDIDYLVNEEITQVEKEGYSYDNISATVVVDATGLSQAEIEEWESAIATAIGADFTKVTFKATPFMLERTEGGKGETPGGTVVVAGSRNTYVFIIIALGVLLVILLIIALVASGSSKKRAKARREGAMAVTLRPAPDSNYPTDEEEDMRKRGYDEVEHEFEIQSLTNSDGVESREELLKKEIREFSKTNPEIVAQLIRTWMRSDD